MERVRFGSTKFNKKENKMKYSFRLSASQIARISCYGTVKKPINVKYVFFFEIVKYVFSYACGSLPT